MRSQLDALIARAVEPGLFSEISIHHGMRSFRYVLDLPVTLSEAPELLCLDLYKDFDLDQIVALAGPVKVVQSDYLEIPPK